MDYVVKYIDGTEKEKDPDIQEIRPFLQKKFGLEKSHV